MSTWRSPAARSSGSPGVSARPARALRGYRRPSLGPRAAPTIPRRRAGKERHPAHVRPGLAYVPEDACATALSLTSGRREPPARGQHMEVLPLRVPRDPGVIRRHCQELVSAFDVKTPAWTLRPGTSSAATSKSSSWPASCRQPRCCLSPTDPGHRPRLARYIHERLVVQRDNGTAVLIIFEDLDEIMSILTIAFRHVRRQDHRHRQTPGRHV